MKSRYIFLMTLAAGLSLPVNGQEKMDSVTDAWLNQHYSLGASLDVTRENSTASVSVIKNDAFSKRSGKNVGNSLIGQGKGLIAIPGGGSYYVQNPALYVRGLQSLSGNTPLILIDGIERDITMVDPEEVEEVQILKDAAATALYGYKGADGVINIITKRGDYNSQVIKFSYEHVFSNMTNKPRFVDAPTYAKAMNEALANEGHTTPRYSADDIAAYGSGKYPYLYPNVNWVNETFRNHASGDRAVIEFSGGGEKFRYFTMGSLLVSDGFIKNPGKNDGYSTQDKYVRGNLRTNLDVDLGQYTQLHTNIFTSLSEMQCPGNQADLWSMVYATPSLAFPVKNENGVWGGNSTWSGDINPVAQSTDAAYYKIFDRQLFFSAEIEQDMSMVAKGLKFYLGGSYDVIANIHEDHSKKYNYGYTPVSGWANGEPVPGTYWEVADQATSMGTASNGKYYARRFNAFANVTYDNTFAGKHHVMAQLKYHYDYEDPMGTNNNVYRHNVSLWGQYTYNNRYSLGVALAEMGSSRLAPGTKWSFSPNVSAGAVILDNPASKVNFLKARASWGIQNLDRLPGDNVWTYYLQSYSVTGVSYPWSDKYDGGGAWGETTLGQMPMVNPTHEKVAKYDVGIDASFLGCINLTADYFFNHSYDIFVDGSGAYSSLIGFTAPFKNQGKVDNRGVDIQIDYSQNFGDWTFMAGGSFLLAQSKIKDMAEEPKAFDNLKNTGNPLSSTYGLIADGLFTKDDFDADGNLVAGIPAHTFSTVRPGDIKYRDINGDNRIDANDKTKIGYNPVCPEIYYTLNLGAEYKGIGITAHLQGAGRYGCNLSSQGYYWGLINNSSLSQEVYDNRWTSATDNPNAMYPRLSSTSNANNYQTSTFWQRDRSYLKLRNVEVYYNFDKKLLAKTKFIKNARVYLRGVDLCNIATGGKNKLENLNPEATGVVAPMSRQIVLGAKLTF
ncbi:MAG: SusC/RagA family TonB-linked outer membrane protein [Clostridiales bacterium]|nr:SusC/RagA family TonB-linked outer membrane protein [Clostridiales bacterium]